MKKMNENEKNERKYKRKKNIDLKLHEFIKTKIKKF